MALTAVPIAVAGQVKSSNDRAVAKLDKVLRGKLASGSNAQVYVFITAKGNGAAALKLLDKGYAAHKGNGSLVIGRIHAQLLPKLAGASGVVAVGAIQFRQTGQPADRPANERKPDLKKAGSRVRAAAADDVPYADAPALAKGHFNQLKRLNLFDARAHQFSRAWKKGYTGTGVTASVLDGGTDFAHPDLLGTWKTGPSGWPEAFDPFSTEQLLLAPSQVVAGLSWYSLSEVAHVGKHGSATVSVSFTNQTGPSRDGHPAGTRTNTYAFPRAWTTSGDVRLANHPDDYLLDIYGERVGVLITDPHTPHVYDTVYVDLDDDHDFSDEKPVTRESPAAYRDLNGDGVVDLSGGLLYYISDGVHGTALPGGPEAFGVSFTAPAGRFLAWSGDYDMGIEGHGTFTASNIVGQAVINGDAPSFADLTGPGHTYPGAVIGGAPDAKLMPMGDIYFDFHFSRIFGNFLVENAGAQTTSNSYGDSDLDNDPYDFGSQEMDIVNALFGGRTTTVSSTGNGAPGYGTTTPPSPASGVKVGASTVFGGTGWDSIANISQMDATMNNVIQWSNKGPGANGSTGVDLTADGAYAPGDETLNAAGGDGRGAWLTWGGTSRSTPVVVGATALLQQAYKAAHGSFADAATVQDILRSSSDDQGFDAWTQGAGTLNANQAVKLASGAGGVTVSPSEWRPGDYHGTEYPVFAHLLSPGGSDTQRFETTGGRAKLRAIYLKRTATETRTFTTAPLAAESAPSFNAPDYLLDVTDLARTHPNALMVVRAVYPYSELDPTGTETASNDWRLLLYNWTDVNHDGRLFTDANGNGVVNHTDLAGQFDKDGDPLIDYSRSEIEQGEYLRFMYDRPAQNSMQVYVSRPGKRVADGVFIGLQRRTVTPQSSPTHFTFQVDFYDQVAWPWVHVPRNTSGSFDATINVPAGTPYGEYEGAIQVTKSGHTTAIPVSVSVSATAAQDADGNIVGTTTFGGADVAAADADALYNNGAITGANDWTWREESGDWRFYNLDVPNAAPDGSLFLAQTSWDDLAPHTDIDTVILGPSANTYQLFSGSSPIYAPYVLDTVGKSPNTFIGSGKWQFNTATGGASDLVTAPVQQGLHEVLTHGVLFEGDKFWVPFQTTVGSARVSPTSVEQTTASDSGSFDVTFTTGVDLPGLSAEAFGLSQPQSLSETVHQDDPDDPTTASTKVNFTVSHASRAIIDLPDVGSDDVDVYVLYDANHDGSFTPGELVASSTGGAGSPEHVELVRPADGAYQVWLHGFQVAGTPTIPLVINVIQGTDLTVTGVPDGPIAGGTTVTLHVTYSKTMTAGQTYEGELLLGPSSAPTVISVPVTIHRS